MQKLEIQIINKLGLHARAAAKFVAAAGKFQSEILVSKGGRTVNGKSIMGVMMLAAAKGAQLAISANGPDEQAALTELQQLIDNRFLEEE